MRILSALAIVAATAGTAFAGGVSSPLKGGSEVFDAPHIDPWSSEYRDAPHIDPWTSEYRYENDSPSEIDPMNGIGR
ncbi:hypothetical protein DDZ14_06845 [Maritimibacter sp. 55A14]|uniref:hypothetical protein n=1 Tax=Maritimibacter sp. 55A14 TaxID=2174844 RepID=UPI000D620EFD|nr:hypothetical protein [Maritimibacter sp. 55A14]PWE33124.1 hypothetical protein DDZ14_06845 [Maritimibacter sp. 55A14]